MKSLPLTLIALFLFNFITSAQSPSAIPIPDCKCVNHLPQSHKDQFSKALQSYEKRLIDSGYLDCYSDSCFYNMVSMINHNTFSFNMLPKPDLTQEISINDSCQLAVHQKLKRLTISYIMREDISLEGWIDLLIDSTSISDYNDPLLRNYCHYLMLNMRDINFGIDSELPPIIDDANDTKEYEVRHVLIDHKDRVFYNGVLCSTQSLKDSVFQYLNNYQNSLLDTLYIESIGDRYVQRKVVRLSCERSTTYDKYLEVYDAISAAYDKARDEISMKEYGLKFDALENSEQIDAIRQLVPKRLSEAEPK